MFLAVGLIVSLLPVYLFGSRLFGVSLQEVRSQDRVRDPM